MFSVDEVEVGNVIDHPPVDLFRNVFVKATITGLHVIHRDSHAAGYERCNGAVGITEHEQCMGTVLLDERLNTGQCATQKIAERTRIARQHYVGCPQSEVFEEHSVELSVVVLSRVNDDLINGDVQGWHDARQADNLRTSAKHRHYL